VRREEAEQLKRTDRWIRKLVARIQDKGGRAIVHGCAGNGQTHRIAEKIEKKAVKIIEREYADFGPTLASEYLARDQPVGPPPDRPQRSNRQTSTTSILLKRPAPPPKERGQFGPVTAGEATEGAAKS
jgi:hypothetical protein